MSEALKPALVFGSFSLAVALINVVTNLILFELQRNHTLRISHYSNNLSTLTQLLMGWGYHRREKEQNKHLPPPPNAETKEAAGILLWMTRREITLENLQRDYPARYDRLASALQAIDYYEKSRVQTTETLTSGTDMIGILGNLFGIAIIIPLICSVAIYSLVRDYDLSTWFFSACIGTVLGEVISRALK